MNVILAYLVGILIGAMLTYGILAAQRKPSEATEPLAIREAEQIVAHLLR